MSLQRPPSLASVQLPDVAGVASFHIKEDEGRATLLVIEYDGVSLPLIWSGNRLRSLDGKSPVLPFMRLPVNAIATALAILPPS